MQRSRKTSRFFSALAAFLVRIAAWFTVWILLLGVALNFIGPYEGWIPRTLSSLSNRHANPRRAEAKRRPSTAAPAPAKTDIRDATNDSDDNVPDARQNETLPHVDATAEKTRLEQMYESLRAVYREEFGTPVPGQHQAVRLRGGQRVEGKLITAKPGAITLAMDYGSMVIPIHRVHPDDYKDVFPERAASIAALRELKTAKAQMENAGKSTATTAETDASVAPQPRDDEQSAAALMDNDRPVTSEGDVVFEPMPQKSDDNLRPLVAAFAQWLEHQHRRVGGRIATTIYGKQQGKAALLYLNMAPQFLAQDYDLRFQMAEGLWQFWAFRCEARGVVRHAESAYLVMLDDHQRIVGGSKPDVGNNVWVNAEVAQTARTR